MKAFNNFLNMFKGDQGEDIEDPDIDDAEYMEDDYQQSKNYSDDYNKQSKVVPMSSSISSSKMVITQPSSYDEAEIIGEYLRNKKAVIINLENVSKEDGQRILDFMSGATFMVEGTIQKVSNLIYLTTPRCVEIQNDVEKRDYDKQRMNFSWMK